MIEIVRGSVLDQDVDVIVNAASTAMRGGGGLDGAVHAAAGPGLLAEMKERAPNGAQTSEPVVTGGHDTGFRHIIHVAGPIWRGGEEGEEALLASCYRNAVRAADHIGVRSLAFPSISTGIYGFPIDRAAPIALRAALDTPHELERIVFAMFGESEYQVFLKAQWRASEDPKPGGLGYLTESQLEEARRVHVQTQGEDLSEVLMSLGMFGEREQLMAKAQSMGMGFVEIDRIVKVEPALLALLPADMMRRLQVLPLKRDGGTLWVAMANPSDLFALEEIRTATGLRVAPVIALADQLRKRINELAG